MNRSIMETDPLARTPLLLQIAAVLILLQCLLWFTRAGSTTTAPIRIAPETSSVRLQSLNRLLPVTSHARWNLRDPDRYYDPSLVGLADGLDAESRYFIAMALEDCYALSHSGTKNLQEDFARQLDSGLHDRVDRQLRETAFQTSIRPCAPFDGTSIPPERVLALLRSAALDGDPRAIARTLLFRDLAESKAGTFDVVTRLLASGDPHAIRDVGFFLVRGESHIQLGDDSAPVRATTLAAAWELAACDFGLDCDGDSKMLTNLCAYQGQCGAFSLEDWLARYTESSEELAEIWRLRSLIRQGLIMHDWKLLGLFVLKSPAASESIARGLTDG
ncbi:MAG: hypothetical protein ABI583_03720 [Betaproteobacteria bacterium]